MLNAAEPLCAVNSDIRMEAPLDAPLPEDVSDAVKMFEVELIRFPSCLAIA